ncbi:Glutathione gamma-glutamylcysteinyltransferase 1 [Linum perenne]
MATAGLYRRVLPSPPAIDFASSEGKFLVFCLKQIFNEAFEDGTMEGFFKLISFYQTQSEPAYCGLASLSMVLNALAIDPGRKWKGPWRWFDESMLDCCEPLERVKAVGISFGKVVCLARCAGAEVEAFRTNQSTIDDYRKHVIKCCSSDNCHVISSYHRGVFKQTGTGHFSPIGGYHAGRDMVLILDVARFKYPPHWVPLSLLWEAMDTIIVKTGFHRGFMVVSKPETESGLLNNLMCKQESWNNTAKYIIEEVPILLATEDVKDVSRVLHVIFMSLPSDFSDFINLVANDRGQVNGDENISQQEKQRLAVKEKVLQEVRETGLFKRVAAHLYSACRNMPFRGQDDHSVGRDSRGCCRVETCLRDLKSSAMGVVNGSINGREWSENELRNPVCDQSNLTDNYPAGTDVVTALLLALPPETWCGIRDEKLVKEIRTLVSTEHLPVLLHDEVVHVWRQLNLLKKCMRNVEEEEEDLCGGLANLVGALTKAGTGLIV